MPPLSPLRLAALLPFDETAWHRKSRADGSVRVQWFHEFAQYSLSLLAQKRAGPTSPSGP